MKPLPCKPYILKYTVRIVLGIFLLASTSALEVKNYSLPVQASTFSILPSSFSGTNVASSGNHLILGSGTASNEIQTITASETTSSTTVTVPATLLGAGGTITLNPGDTASSVQTKLASLAAIGSTANISVTGSTTNASGKLYTTDWTGNTLSVLNTSTNAITKTVTVGNGPEDVAFIPNGSKAYVANTTDNTVSVIDTSTDSVIATIPVGNGPQGVAASPDNSTVYITNTNDGTVSVIRTSTDTVIATITVGQAPTNIAASPDGQTVYVANSSGGTVSVIDTSTNTVTSTITIESDPTTLIVSPDSATLYVADIHAISVINTSTQVITSTHSIGPGVISALAISPNGGTLYVAKSVYVQTGTLLTIPTSTWVQTPYTIGPRPVNLSLTPDGSTIYISSQDNFEQAYTTSPVTGGDINPSDQWGTAVSPTTTFSSGTYTITFQNALASYNVAPLTVSNSEWGAATVTNGGPGTYAATGSGHIQIQPVPGTKVHWLSTTPGITTPTSTLATLTYSTDGGLTYASSLTNLSPSETLDIQATLTTSDSALTPSLDSLSVAYQPITTTFTTPTTGQSYLVGDGTGAITSISVTWSVSDTYGTDHIQTLYSLNSGTTWTVLSNSLTPSTTHDTWTPTNGITSTTAEFKVDYIDSSGAVLTSAVSNLFSIATNAAPLISLISPPPSTSIIAGSTPTFSATVGDTNTGDSVIVDWQLCSDPICTNIVQSVSGQTITLTAGSGSFTHQATTLTTGTYYWQARVTDSHGATYNWTTIRTLQVLDPITPTPTPTPNPKPRATSTPSPSPSAAVATTTPQPTPSPTSRSTPGVTTSPRSTPSPIPTSTLTLTVTVTSPSKTSSVNLSWTRPSPLTQGYSIYRSTQPNVSTDTNHLLARITNPSQNTYVDQITGSENQHYYYRIVTFSDHLESVTSNTVQVSLASDPSLSGNRLIQESTAAVLAISAGLVVIGSAGIAIAGPLAQSGDIVRALQLLLIGIVPRRRKRWGTVTEQDTHLPIIGEPVILLDSRGKELDRTITNRWGDFSLIPPQSGIYAVTLVSNRFTHTTQYSVDIPDPDQPPKPFALHALPTNQYTLRRQRTATLVSTTLLVLDRLRTGIFLIGGMFSIASVYLSRDLLSDLVCLGYLIGIVGAFVLSLIVTRTYGTVCDEYTKETLFHAEVLLFAIKPDGTRLTPVRVASTDQRGRYRFRLNPGTYQLHASHTGYLFAQQGPFTLQRSKPASKTINLVSDSVFTS